MLNVKILTDPMYIKPYYFGLKSGKTKMKLNNGIVNKDITCQQHSSRIDHFVSTSQFDRDHLGLGNEELALPDLAPRVAPGRAPRRLVLCRPWCLVPQLRALVGVGCVWCLAARGIPSPEPGASIPGPEPGACFPGPEPVLTSLRIPGGAAGQALGAD